MRIPPTPANLSTRCYKVRELLDDIRHDYAQCHEYGYIKGARGESGGRPSGDSDPTGELAANPWAQWSRRTAQGAMLDAEEHLKDALASLDAAHQALFRPFKERGPRDPMKDLTRYDRTVSDGELEASRDMVRARRRRGEE